MKAVLMSIQPKWCELIASGKKTVEVRKTKPKLETPFKVYIYETKDKQFEYIGVVGYRTDGTRYDFLHRTGKVIGEFVCDDITDIRYHEEADGYCVGKPHPLCDYYAESTCLKYEELHKYLQGKQGYGWHITDLVIYDDPKELSEFKTICRNAYCQNDWGNPTWFCKDGYGSCAVTDKEKEYPYNEECIYFDCPSVGGESCEYEDYAYCNCDGLKPITRPPQSWMYVEEVK